MGSGFANRNIKACKNMTSKINREWHEKNKMPKNPTFEQRVAWHLAHREHCPCRPIPEKLAAEMKKKNIEF